MDTFEPHDLDEMTPHDALDAVLTDIQAHPVNPGPGGFFTALHHVDLLSQLTLRFTGDAHYYLGQAHETGSAWRPVEALTAAAVPVSRALSHYTQAIVPLAALSKPGPVTTPAARLEGFEGHRALRAHLHAARQSLAEAHTTLREPAPPTPAAACSTTRATEAAPHTQPVRLSPNQHQALHTINRGGAELCETTRGRTYVAAPGGQRITMTTYNSLERKGLVSRDTGTSLFTGQRLFATERGRTVLASLPAPTAAPAPGLPPRPAPQVGFPRR
ncbi:hypothetical protein ABZ769_34320 [Streptomyces olivoreticuli]